MTFKLGLSNLDSGSMLRFVRNDELIRGSFAGMTVVRGNGGAHFVVDYLQTLAKITNSNHQTL